MSNKYDRTINGRRVPVNSYREIRNRANTDEVVGLRGDEEERRWDTTSY